MHKKFEINRTKINGVSHSGIKVVPHDSKSDLPLIPTAFIRYMPFIFIALGNIPDLHDKCGEYEW